jgi:hypothetical protein
MKTGELQFVGAEERRDKLKSLPDIRTGNGEVVFEFQGGYLWQTFV